MNPEFGSSEALLVAEKYSRAVGRLPAFLLADVDTIWIHRGLEAFGGGNREYRITIIQTSIIAFNYTRGSFIKDFRTDGKSRELVQKQNT